MKQTEIVKILSQFGLKATQQRIAVLSVMNSMSNHPSVEDIYKKLYKKYPTISLATVYKTVETFEQIGLIKKIRTDCGYVRYDSVIEPHYHLYSFDDNRLEDYFDDDLNNLLKDYFKKKRIPGFTVNDFNLQILGTFSKNKQ